MSIYTYNGLEFSEEDVIAKAEEKGLDLDSYINEFGIKRKEDKALGKPKPAVKKDAVAAVKSTVSKSVNISSEQPGFDIKDPTGVNKAFNNVIAPVSKVKTVKPVKIISVEKPKQDLRLMSEYDSKAKEEEDGGFFNYLKESFDSTVSVISQSFYKAPEYAYDFIASNITDPAINVVSEAVGGKKYENNSDKIMETFGIRNVPAEILQKKINASNKIIKDYSDKNGGDPLTAIESGNYLGAAKLIAGATAQSMPIVIASILSGGSSTAMAGIAASTAISKSEELKISNPEIDTKTRTNVSAVSGLLEGYLGQFFTGASGRIAQKILVDKGTKAGSKIISNGLIGALEKVIEKNPVVGVLGEVIEESGVDFGNQINEINAGIRKELDYRSIANSGLSSIGMAGTNTVPIYAAKGYMKLKDYNQVKAVNKEINGLTNQLSSPYLSDSDKKLITSRVNRLVDENKAIAGASLEKINALPGNIKSEINTINIDLDDLKSKYLDIADNSDLPAETKKAMVDEIKLQAKELDNRKNSIIEGNYVFDDFNKLSDTEQSNFKNKATDFLIKENEKNKDASKPKPEIIDRKAVELYNNQLRIDNAAKEIELVGKLAGTKNVAEIKNGIGENKIVEIFDTPESLQEAYNKYHAANKFTGKPRDVSEDAGFALGDQIVINRKVAENFREGDTVGRHELLHKILKSSFSDPEAAAKLKNNFLSALSSKEKSVIEKRLKDRGYTEQNLMDAPDEYLTQFFEALETKEIEYSDTSFLTMWKSFLQPIYQKLGFRKLDFKSGADVYTFIKDYHKSVSKGELSKRAIALKEKGIDTGVKESSSKVKVAEVQAKIDKLEDQLDTDEIDYDTYENRLKIFNEELKKAKLVPEVEKPKVEKPKVEVTEEDEVKEIIKNEKGSVASDKVQKIYETKGLNGAQDIIDLFKPITKKIVDKRRDAPGFDRQLLTDEVETGAGGILDLIRTYDPSKGAPLAAYINKQLPLRAIASSKRVLDKQFNKDAAEEVGLMATETADERFAETEKEKPKYKNALESKVLEPDVLKTVYNKILTNVRTLKNRIDAPISLNRTITPIIAEIRDAMGKQLDIDLKTAMGGKKDNQLRSFALKNKKYFLENMTTTFLMGADGKGGVPQAIQKQIDGKWTNYPDWVGKKIDREKTTTDNAGRTSGAEIVRRLPNAINNVSDADYLGQLLEADGNPIRGRKESWAKAMGEEIAFDIINDDLANEGVIFEALSANQQRLGYEVTNALATEIARQSDRGNVKSSKVGVFAIDKVSNEFYNFYKDLDSNEKSNVLQYLDKREEKYLKNINSKSKEDLLNILDKWKNAYINNFDKLKNKFYDEANKKFKEDFNNVDDFDKYLAKETEYIKTSKAATLGVALRGLDFNTKNEPTINEIKRTVKQDLENQLKNAKTKEEKIDIANSFLRIYRAIFTGGTVGGKFYKTNSELFKELNTIKEFKDLGYSLKGKDKKMSIVFGKLNNKTGKLEFINPTFVYEQSASAGDVAVSIQLGQDVIATEKRKDENTQSLKDVLRFVNWVKESNMTNKAKAMLSIALGTSTYSPLRTLAKIDSIILDANTKNPKDYVWEHALPVDEMVRGILSYVLDSPIGLKPALNKEDLKALLNESKVSIIPRNINDILNKILKDKMPASWKVGDNIYKARYFNKKTLDYLIKGGIDLRPSDLTKLIGKKGDIIEINFKGRENDIKNNNKINSITYSLKPSKTTKGISVFDFDDTVGLTEGNVLYTMPDGSKGKLNAEEFAKEGSRFLEEGAVFDFSEFSKVVGGKPGPMVEKMKKMIGKFGPDNFFILTARPANAAGPIHEFLSSIGIDIPLENITGLGNSTAQAKADWMVGKAAEGYNDFYFSDDAIQNVKAVKDALDVLDVKSKIQQARLKFSKTISPEFNKIIEQNTGMEDFKVFSDIVARRRGTGKNRFDFYVPASAADFELLLYKFIGKGALGEEQKKFFDDALLKPYANGNDLMDAARQSIKKDYKALTDIFPGIKKTIESLTPDGDFTYDQAIRVAMWNEEGVEIPGISQRDSRKLTDLVNADPELKAFKEGLIVTGRQGKGWVKPENFWDANTIISDLHNLTEGEGRKKFLAEFVENAELMFGKWEQGRLVGPNINKVEAVYGTNVREAIEDVLWRMTTGKNRGYGKDKETSRWSNWVNGSTGTIMFLNTRSAALQLIGAVNFLNLRDNNPFAAAKAFANQKQYWADFAYIWNSDKIKERRGGLKEDVAAAEVANAAASSTNKANAVISYLLKVGYTPTQLADSFAIASGGAPYYRNRIKTYLSEGLSEQEAETKAWSDFTKVADETQQSGDPRDISKQQASGAGRLLLTFQNTAMQQSRIVKKSFLDLKNGRGDAKTNVAKIIYYLGVQNVLFAALQQGLIAVGFGFLDDEEDEAKKKALEKEKDKKVFDITNGVIDTILSGTGFVGKVVVTLKNMAKVYLDERDKNFKADYAKVVLEAANISPPIGSKLRKLYSGLQQTKYDKDLIKERGWGVMQDGRVHLGPMYSVAGKVVEAGTNVPLDRLATKIENASQAMNSQNEAWQRVMIGLGFNPYSLGVKETKGDVEIEATAKEIRKEEGQIKAKETRERTKDSIRGLPREERRKLKRESLLKRREKKIKKRKMG